MLIGYILEPVFNLPSSHMHRNVFLVRAGTSVSTVNVQENRVLDGVGCAKRKLSIEDYTTGSSIELAFHCHITIQSAYSSSMSSKDK